MEIHPKCGVPFFGHLSSGLLYCPGGKGPEQLYKLSLNAKHCSGLVFLVPPLCVGENTFRVQAGDHQASSGQQKLHLTYPMGESHPDRNVNPWVCCCDRLMKPYRTCLLHYAARTHIVIILSGFFQTQANTTRCLSLAPPITTSVVSAVGPWIGPRHIMKRAWLLSWKAIVVIGNELTLLYLSFLTSADFADSYFEDKCYSLWYMVVSPSYLSPSAEWLKWESNESYHHRW